MSEPIEVNGCCKKVNITCGNTFVMFDKFKYEVKVFYCKNCGSKKASSYINEVKSQRSLK